ncbi:MAG: ectoine synthase [Moorea sp. SIO3I7]|uniref:ectoine synthase n=1 Tax=unclassified Moorena TaxID=2683338 RepID=UPI0013C0E388|nr:MULTISPECIES: ectoine synthase [unclassified Moorena]NEN94720.1 ectoine synthase [Moorena sp. SIO3I7]NEO07062.1 ectoine synthase [Moorena sp. SIO3I8]NEQ61927.1 ectoine synthase [Moorena sp. SIO4A1]
MIVRRLKEIIGTKREVKAPNGNWTSRRFLLKDDQVGFSLHDTLIHAGTETYIWYKYHIEAVYCVAGNGEIEDIETGEIHPISDGTLYFLNKHERHYLRATETMRMICVFNPPLTGEEVHNKEGFYEINSESS